MLCPVVLSTKGHQIKQNWTKFSLNADLQRKRVDKHLWITGWKSFNRDDCLSNKSVNVCPTSPSKAILRNIFSYFWPITSKSCRFSHICPILNILPNLNQYDFKSFDWFLTWHDICQIYHIYSFKQRQISHISFYTKANITYILLHKGKYHIYSWYSLHSWPGLGDHGRPQLGPQPDVQGEQLRFWFPD